MLCQTLKVARSAYYRWLKQPLSSVVLRNQFLTEQIAQLFKNSRQTYGSPRIHHALLRNGEKCSLGRVKRLMCKAGFRAITKNRPHFHTPPREENPAGNLLADRSAPQGPNEVWVGDITYLKTQEGWLYLAAVLDLHSRKLVGWTLSDRMTSDLVISAFNMALKQRNAVPEVFHSDKGSQYTSTAFRNLLRKNSIQISNSGVGNCYDNATMERFFRTLKEECTDRLPLTTREALKGVVFEFVEVFYNRQRLHSALGYLTPTEFEALQDRQQHVAA